MRARNALIGGEYKKSEIFVRKIYNIYNATPPAKTVPTELNIFAAHVFRKSGDCLTAIECARTAATQLQSIKKTYSIEEREYLACYCSRVVEFCSKNLDIPYALSDGLNGSDPSLLKIKLVRSEILREYPMATA
jgi:hypothetical protein